MNTKEVLRKTYLQKRQNLDNRDFAKLNDMLLIQFQRLVLPPSETLLSYLPIKSKNEPNTYIMVQYLSYVIPMLQVCYPVTDADFNSFSAHLINEETNFGTRKFDITEPINGLSIDPRNIDLVFVPLLVADSKGYRVGYGKGMYDKFLSQCKPDVLKIGFSFFEPISTISDIDKNDIPLDVLITPEQTFHFYQD